MNKKTSPTDQPRLLRPASNAGRPARRDDYPFAEIGERFRERRKQLYSERDRSRHMSQTELARKMGITQSALGSYERGEANLANFGAAWYERMAPCYGFVNAEAMLDYLGLVYTKAKGMASDVSAFAEHPQASPQPGLLSFPVRPSENPQGPALAGPAMMLPEMWASHFRIDPSTGTVALLLGENVCVEQSLVDYAQGDLLFLNPPPEPRFGKTVVAAWDEARLLLRPAKVPSKRGIYASLLTPAEPILLPNDAPVLGWVALRIGSAQHQ